MKSMLTIAIVVLSLLALVSPSDAELVCTIKLVQNTKHLMVIKPGKYGEFLSLTKNNMLGELFSCCVSCIVEAGSKVIVTNQSGKNPIFRILEGPSQGCVGELPIEYFENCN